MKQILLLLFLMINVSAFAQHQDVDNDWMSDTTKKAEKTVVKPAPADPVTPDLKIPPMQKAGDHFIKAGNSMMTGMILGALGAVASVLVNSQPATINKSTLNLRKNILYGCAGIAVIGIGFNINGISELIKGGTAMGGKAKEPLHHAPYMDSE